MTLIKSISIITSPFGCIPPNAIGAVEKRWKSCGDYFLEKGIDVTFISKMPSESCKSSGHNIYIKGYSWTGSKIKDLLLDFIYSFKALWKMPKCDAVVLNTIFTPVLLPLFKWKYKVSLYNVARFPKKQLGAYRAVDILSCVSNVVYKCMLEQTPSTKRQGCVINNFINTDIYHPLRKHNRTDNPIVLFTGRVHREKGLELLVKAINEVRKTYNISLKVIGAWEVERGGSGQDYVDELNNLASGWEIDWVDPIYDPKLLSKEMDKCDIYCYPSLADKGETFGVAPLEAMGLGIPTVVSALECFSDFLKDKESGLVFDHHSPNAVSQLADCILYIMRSDKDYDSLSKNAIQAAAEFTIENKAEEYLCVLNNVLNYGCLGFDDNSMKVKQIDK